MRHIEITSDCNKILFLGDVFPKHLPSQPIAHNIPFVINLEAPIVEHGQPIPGKINLKSSRQALESLFSPQPVAVSLANNHILDYGNEGFDQTLKILQEMGVAYFGAGTEKDQYNNPLLLIINNIRIALFGYCYAHYYEQIAHVGGLRYGPAPLIPEQIKIDIEKVRGSVDLVVLQLHWGTLYSNYPTSQDVAIARDLTEHGADIIVGHHCHTVQPVEVYKNAIIAYGLGNYLFPDLDLPAYFDQSGIATRNKVERQRAWNRASAGIVVDMKTREHAVKYFVDSNDAVIEKKHFFHRYLYSRIPENTDTLEAMIDKNLKLKKTIQRLFSFIENPRVPSTWKLGKHAK
jgi:poly-gamma-glutamate synthesis protein (capsule biosynthesis protein)